jgi:thiol-disulfide isomerase/thioredoxin
MSLKYAGRRYYPPFLKNKWSRAGVCEYKTSMKTLILIFMALISFNSPGQNTRNKMSETMAGHQAGHPVTVVNFDKLKTIIRKNDNKLYVVNFWATWCKPCVMELPEFMEVNKTYRNNPRFKMILVSLDPAMDVETAVKPFLQKNKIEAAVYLLDDNKRMNTWIPDIDKSWSGAIPATVFYRNGKKLEFRESKMEKNDLVQMIRKYL